ncbi:MAG: methylmalonyl Co-A mutase-associated GTPase MeaB [Gemmatimonadota bacterium]|nr:methylmalonyl Co-A mutase-associated GTPase MeaB [Gemmatimonadota bacterium]
MMGKLSEPIPAQLESLLESFCSGERVALARAISVIEDKRPGFEAFLHRVLQFGPRAKRLGLTGPPGAGKSSLIATLSTLARSREERVGIVAVDPTSPYSGGALLGDRIRMNDVATDSGIFIRSMATRGSLGGLAITSKEVIDLMDAFGMGRLMVETVGIGQTELEITGAVDTVIVVLVPESGDGIQAMKAGMMEIADIFVVNKADRPGADRLVKDLQVAVNLRKAKPYSDEPAHHGVDYSRVGVDGPTNRDPELMETTSWTIPVLKTVAQSGEGVEELLAAVDRHHTFLDTSGELFERRRARAAVRVREVADRELCGVLWQSERTTALLEAGLDLIETGDATPYSVSSSILTELFASTGRT